MIVSPEWTDDRGWSVKSHRTSSLQGWWRCIRRCTPSDRTPRTPAGRASRDQLRHTAGELCYGRRSRLTWQPSAALRKPRTDGDAGAAPVMIIRSLPPKLACKDTHIIQSNSSTAWAPCPTGSASRTWILWKKILSHMLSLRITPRLTSAPFLLAAKFSSQRFTELLAWLKIWTTTERQCMWNTVVKNVFMF